MSTKVCEYCIDDWGILKHTVPGIEQAVLNQIQSLLGKPVAEISGDGFETGYRDGTRWLHLYGITQEIFESVEQLVLMMSKPYQDRINEEKDSERNGG